MAFTNLGDREGESASGSPQHDRRLMVEYLRRQGIHNERVLAAMGRIPRHRFVEESHWSLAYANHPLPISEGQTISQPYIVALMTEELCPEPGDRILEIGTGSGYQMAILAELAGTVYSVERVTGLAEAARQRLQAFRYDNIHIQVGDGTVGWQEFAPYDGIIATGSLPEPPNSFKVQLADPGRMVLPLGGRELQRLTVLRKTGGCWSTKEICYCSFLPLVGREGWPEEEWH